MRIKRLELKNFRGFEELVINFPEDLNVAVFVGVNGAGKTSVLEAIVNLIENIFYELINPPKYPFGDISIWRLLNKKDARIGTTTHHEPCQIKGNFEILGSPFFIFNNTTTGNGNIMSRPENDIIYKSIQRLKDAFFDKNWENIPVPIYFSTDRVVEEEPSLIPFDFGSIDSPHIIKIFFDQNNNFKDFFNWFRSAEDSENELRLYDYSEYRDKGLEAVRKAISTFLPNFRNPRVQRQPQEELIVEKNGEKLSISNLSHGERLMFAMVGDIARRLSIANPGLEDPLQGEGVVLIDEIELHLHPGWQRKIVPLLTQTFPNIQFILTTHSPQVISSVKKESVFLLENFQLKNISASLGRDSNSILEEVFLIPERPEEISKDLEKVYNLMSNAETIGEAKDLLKEIEQKYEVSRDEEVMQAKMHLEFLEE